MRVKPHLKLHVNGHVSVLRQGDVGWKCKQAKAAVVKHYGSMAAFARLYRLEYRHVQDALETDYAEARAGGIAHVRQLLGLRSIPTEASARQVAAQQARRRSDLAARAWRRPA